MNAGDEMEAPLPLGWTEEKLQKLRQQLKETTHWPDTADLLLSDLIPSGQLPEDEDIEMLSLLVSDALSGIDISAHYPTYYRKMLTNSQLHEMFLDAMEMLKESAAQELEGVTADLATSTAVAFYPRIQQPQPGKWYITWQRTLEQLQTLFAPSLQPAYRSLDNFLEDGYLSLLQSEVQLDDAQLDVSLEAVKRVEDPTVLYLQLLIIPAGSKTTEGDLPSLQARLKWGDYDETVDIQQWQTPLPPLPLAVLLDEEGQTLRADLYLHLEVGES